MKALLRLIEGGKPPKMKFASFGRERDIGMIEQWVTDPIFKARCAKQTVAAHDLNDGIGTVNQFIKASREAIMPATDSFRDAPLTLLSGIGRYYPECFVILHELAASKKWQDRFSVACRLYWYFPEGESNRLFHELRHDKSTKVRHIAVARYEDRPNPKYIERVFDADKFDERVRRGEVKL